MREVTVPPVVTGAPVGGLADCVFRYALDDPGRVVLGRKRGGRWGDVTSGEFAAEVLGLARGLLAQGVRFGDRVALMARTRYEWTLFDFALWAVGAQPVPVYPSSSAEQVQWILSDSGCTACVVENEDQAMTVGSVVEGLPQLRRLWQLDAGAVESLLADGRGVAEDVVHRHRAAVTPDSVATVIYTSGTTGRPKGCVLTHGNFMYEADTLVARWESVFRAGPGEVPSTLLFLPLAHVFGRMVEVAAVRARVRLGHQPVLAAAELLPDLAAFRPTFVLGVPHVFEKVFAAARRKAEAEGRAGAFDRAVETAVRYAEAREQQAFGLGPGPSAALRVEHRLFERLVYGKVREALGGQVRHAMSGGSAMPRRLGLFFDGAGITVFEGYGLTESCAAATANPPGAVKYGTVGRPIPGSAVHIAEDGEVWLHGAHVFSGYLGDARSTQAVLRGGWLATGDLGRLDEDGYLTITGRKKEILVTSNGKSVAPAALEERVCSHPLVAQCVLVGNDRPYVAALITLDPEGIAHWLSMRGLAQRPPAQLVRDPDLTAEVRRAVVAANTLVSQAEAIRAFRVLEEQFTEERGLLTPSLKLKRRAIEKRYAQDVADLYRDSVLPRAAGGGGIPGSGGRFPTTSDEIRRRPATPRERQHVNQVPAITLNNGTSMPRLGFGVWQIPDDEAQAAVGTALEAGYRSIDTASVYRNEPGTGKAIAASGLPREELFVTTKLWNSTRRKWRRKEVLRAFEDSLSRLGLDYVDLYLIHWPRPMRDDFLYIWEAFEELAADGRARAVGVSNFRPADLDRIRERSSLVPAVNQVELHPFFPQAELRAEHARRGIATEAWSPLGQGPRLLTLPVVAEVAARHGRTAAQVVLRWHLQLGNIAIPKSVTPSRIRENLDVFGFELDAADMAALDALAHGPQAGRIGPDPAVCDL